MSALAVVAADPLATLPTKINTAVSDAEQHARHAVQRAIEAGKLLRQAKSLLQYGEFETWVIKHCSVAPRTAKAYMRLAEKFPFLKPEERQRVAELPLRQAITAVITPPEAPPIGGASSFR